MQLADLTVELTPLPPWHELGLTWKRLEERADGSFFTSWTWIGAWLATVPAINARYLLRAHDRGEVVALAVVSRAVRRRHMFRHTDVLFLNQAGDDTDDVLFIEYNDLLIDRDAPAGTREAVIEALARICPRPWTELQCAAVVDDLARALQGAGTRTIRVRPCPWVALPAVIPSLDGYVDGLGRNTRHQIRRSIRLMGGPLTIAPAVNVEQALRFFEELKLLHVAAWQRRIGRPGAFRSAYFEPFVRAMIGTGIKSGAVDLLRVTAGDETVGVLLNLVRDGHVYAYQSGFAYASDNRRKPGLVSHALAIVHYRQRDYAAYHFMAGDGRYKTSLAAANEDLSWISFRRDSFWLKVDDTADAIKGLLWPRSEPNLQIQVH